MSETGFDIFMSNPYWKRIYEEASSDELRAYYKIMFNTSAFLRKEKANIELERSALRSIPLSEADVIYLRDHAGSGILRDFYSKILAKLDGRENRETLRILAIVFCGEERNPWFQERPRQE